MRRVIILTAGLFVAAVVLAEVFAAESNEPAQLSKKIIGLPKNSRLGLQDEGDDLKPPKAAPKTPAPADANEVRKKIKQFEGLEKALESLDKESQRETREWLRGPAGEMMRLVKVVHEQVVAELALIQKLAVEEGAFKTATAIDGVLLDREERFEKLLSRMEAELRRMRRAERDMTRDRGRMRNVPDRLRDRGRYPEAYGNQDMYPDEERYGDRERYRDDRLSRDRRLRRDGEEQPEY